MIVQAPGTDSAYSISTRMNAFTPSSFVTTVCAHPQGDVVGDFECVLRPFSYASMPREPIGVFWSATDD